jgi:hypothetical protein
MTMRETAGVFMMATVLLLPAVALAQPRETVGVITEVKVAGGKVEVRTSGGAWRPATPLQALRAGDEVRATQGATAVVLLSGGRGTAKIDAAGSPYVVAPAADASQADKARALVSGSMKFLTSAPKEPPKAVLATRSLARPPVVLTPRNGPVLPEALVFEWVGSPSARFTVRITGASDLLLERAGVVGARFLYPAGAPALRPGVTYRFEVVAPNQPPHTTTFEVVDAARAQAVHADLRELDRALGPGVSPSSLAVARAAYLAEHGLFHDARLAVLAALARDPDEPTLHTLLGSFYTQTGLPQQAAQAFDEAESLMTRGH